ncbi:hypothetical protein B4U80_09650 [Leptotrombidium deliense]|uniref:CAP-Gly domain-containing protein n=1 Tax=Leptotrombidium deliense TaxID=299467 RepID=A0A443S937_9ACAR|nr:hypothetical protein B4U80_09650 [Leptotrombidium deliense]
MNEPLTSTVYFKKGLLDYETSKLSDANTDDYIVGDRVWVNGIKPGYIQYIGETHFGPGDWAGIVLDEPTGKYDGSVGTKRYFYCEPKRGIFCRLEKLSRYPENGAGSPDSGISGSPGRRSYYCRSPRLSSSPRIPSSPRFSSYYRSLNDHKSETITRRTPDGKYSTTTTFHTRDYSPTRSLSPVSGRDTFQTYSLPKRPAKTITKVSQTTTTVDGPVGMGPLKVGDKVFVNSSKGVLGGRLRYLGKTDFSSGYWAGVQLDEPMGKNDGAYKLCLFNCRYFYCPHLYGLFAPAYKVVKADPKRMTTITKVTRVNP